MPSTSLICNRSRYSVLWIFIGFLMLVGCQSSTNYYGSIDPDNLPSNVVIEGAGITEIPIGADLYDDDSYPFTTNGWLSFKEDGSIYFYPNLNLFEDKKGYRLTLPDRSIAPRGDYDKILKPNGDVTVVIDNI